jgi:hypothetical protein
VTFEIMELEKVKKIRFAPMERIDFGEYKPKHFLLKWKI